MLKWLLENRSLGADCLSQYNKIKNLNFFIILFDSIEKFEEKNDQKKFLFYFFEILEI